ncbi:MAG: PAS domain-containing protein, partial [Methanogenium sp.]|nr:PAS domain-containing protein [Methanogenium sp.]
MASLLDITERKAAKARIDHYNSVLLAIRDLNQLITHETDPVCLITQTPEVLTRTGGYHNVWIATIDDSGHVAAAAESGLGEVLFRHMRDRLDTGDFPGCVRSAMAGEAAVVVTEDPAAACPDCPLSATCSPGRGVMTTRVESGGRVYGVISITVPSAFVNVENEQALFMEAATDIAFALHTMDLEEERAAAHQTMMDIIEFLPDATFVIDRDGRVITWNRAIEEMTGIKAKDMIGKGDHEYAIPFYGTRRQILIDLAFAGEDEHWLRDHYPHIRKEGNILITDISLPSPLGRRSVLMGTASPLYDSSGRVMGAIESIRDITERKLAEKKLAAAHQKMMDIIEFLPDATLVIDSDRRVIAWNRAIEEMTGVKAEEMIGKGDYEYAIPFYGERRPILIDLVFAGEDELIQKQYSHIQRDGEVLIAETTLPSPLGRRSILMGTASPLYDSSGRVTGAIESISDITNRKAAEHALEMANKKLQLLS